MSENSEISDSVTRIPECPISTCRAPEMDINELQWRVERNMKAYNDMMHRMKVKLLKEQVLADLKAGLEDTPNCMFSEMIQKDSENVRLVTINLPDKWRESLSDLVKDSNKIIKSRKFVTDGSQWVFEQRGKTEEEMGKGVHIHIVIYNCKKYPNEIVRDLCKPFKVDDGFVNVVTRPKKVAENYILGRKDTKKEGKEDKGKKQDIDDIWRLRNNIEKKYLK